MKLADAITITLGADSITLRPSLRCAIRLERRSGSFGQLIKDIMDGSLTAACEIIADHASLPMLETRILDNGLDALRMPLVQYVTALAGMDPDDDPAGDDSKPKGKPQSFKDYLSGLYQIGTGWLGWTPFETLDSTPTEIILAYEGRLAMLKAIFGGSEQQAEAPAPKGDWGQSFAFNARARQIAMGGRP